MMRRVFALAVAACFITSCSSKTDLGGQYYLDLQQLKEDDISETLPKFQFRLEIKSLDEQYLYGVTLDQPSAELTDVRLIIAPSTPDPDKTYPNLGYFEEQPIQFGGTKKEGYKYYKKLNFALVGPDPDLLLRLYFFDGLQGSVYEVKS